MFANLARATAAGRLAQQIINPGASQLIGE
jgi:hypothetical protein